MPVNNNGNIFLSYQNGKSEVLTPSQYEARKDSIYKNNPTATAVQISRYKPDDDDIADDDVYRISSSVDEPFEVDGKKFRKNRDALYSAGLQGLKVEKLRPVKYFADQGDNQKAIVDRQLASLDEAEKAIDEKAFAAYKEQNSQPKSFGARLLQSAASAGYANRGVSGLADPTNYSGWLNTHGKEYGDELRNYQAAKSLLKEARTMQNTLTKDEARSAEGLGRVGKFFKGVAQGQAKTLGDVESWVPFVGAENASAMYGLQKKIESIIGNLPEDASGTAIENAIKKGLSPSERQLFDAVQTSGAVTSSLQDEIAGSVKIGEVMAMSERMGLEFLLFDSIAGSPARGAGRAVTKYLEKRLVKDGLSKGARKLAQGAAKVAGQEVGAAVGGAIQTAVGPSNWSQVAKNTEAAMQAFMSSPAQFMSPETRAKYGIKGPEQMGEMMWDGVADMFFENATEFGLGPFNKLTGAVGRGGYRALRKLGWDKLATLLSPQASAFLQKMGVASLSEELGEEVNNAIIDYFRGNKEAIGDFFDPENLGIMVASFVPTIGVGAGVSAVQRGSLKNKYNNAAAAYQDYLVNQKGMKPEDAAEVVASVNGASPEELGHKAGILLNALDQSKNSQDKGTEAELIMNLLTTARDYNAANGVDQLVRNEEREKARDEVMKNTGNHQFWQTRPEQMLDEAGDAYIGDGEYVDYLTTDGDNNFYIRKENPDGTLETVDENGVVRTLDPADVRQGLADGTFKARKQLSMDEFLDLRNGVKKDQMWEVSAERTGVLGAYRAAERSGDSATHGDIYMVGKTVQDAAGELVSLGVDESVLDNTPEDIAKMAFEERQAGNEDVAAALSDYATAKSAYQGLHAGYMAGVTARGEKAAAEKVNQFGVQQRDGSVTVTTAALDGAPVFVLSPDAVVAQDGSVSVLGGTPESKVMVADESGNTRLVSVADLANAEVMSGEQFAEGITGYYADFAEQKYQEMQSTTPYGGKVAALAQYIGHTILIQSENGEVGSVKILNMNPQENTATIKDVSGQGAEDSVSIDALYDMAQKDEGGNISIDPDAEDNAQLMQPSRPQAPQPQAPQGGGVAAPAPSARPQGAQVNPAEIESLVGTEVPIALNGRQVNAFVSGISEGNVEFEYPGESGNTRPGTLSVEEFAAAMQGAQPAAEAETETAEPEAQSTLPRKGDDLDWNAIFSADPKTFAGYLPELVQEMHRLFPGEELKYAQSWYGKAKAELDKSKEMTGDPAKDAANKKKRAGAETKVANYGTLILTLRPATQSAGASLAQAPEAQEPAAPEENVPDISDDTPSAAQKRGYVVQNGNRIDRAGEDAIVAEGDDTKISFTKTDVADAKYGLAEAERVIPSHVNGQENALHFFARDWQPKDRTRTDSEVAINQMANNLRPEEITRGVTAYGGAPVVNARGEVIQGNGRSEALRRAYEGGKADAYKAWLAEHAEEFGLTAEQVEAMEHPVLVRVMAVDDATAENYGKKEQKDLESGGDARFNGKTLAQKLGKNLPDFIDILFGGDLGEDASFAEYVEANGGVALRWLHENNYIGDTEFQNALETTRSGEQKFTEETVAAFKQLALEPLFADGTEKVRAGYEKLSKNAKLALQASVAKLSQFDGVIEDLQAALSYLYDYESADPTFQKAKTAEEAWKAIQEWAQNLRMDTGKSEGELHPSIVGNHFAAILKAAKGQKDLIALFSAIADAMRGQGDLFDQERETLDRLGAYKANNVISEEEEKILRNGTEDNNGASAPASGEQTGPAESGDSGVEGGSGEVRAEGEGDNGAESGGAAPAESVGEGEGSEEVAAEEQEQAPAEEAPAPEEAPEADTPVEEAPALLTEEEIRNSGYDDPTTIEQAVDFINGNTGNILNRVAYQTIEDYVRIGQRDSQSSGESGNGVSTQLGTPANGTQGAASERGGNESGSVGEGGSAQGVSGTATGVQPGGESGSDIADTTPGSGNTVRNGAGNAGRGNTRGRSGDSGRGHELHNDGQGEGAGSRDAVADANGKSQARLEQLDSEIADLVGDLKELLGGTPKAEEETKSADEGILFRDAEEGKLSAEWLRKLGQAAKITTQIGFKLIQKGYYTLADYVAKLADAIGALLKNAGLSDSEIDEFIRASWDSLYSYNGEVHRVSEWASILRDKEFRRMAELGLEEKRKLQKEANERNSEVKLGDIVNIQEQLPFLFSHQHENVEKAEKQFFSDEATKSHERAYGKGMMFTDGTGTGKTYTGLGVIKRFFNRGKKRILLVCPAGKVVDWQHDAKNLGLSPEALMTTGKGKEFVVMSYESFRANKDIMEDTFDLVVYDEAHKMMSSTLAADTQALAAHYAISNRNAERAFERITSVHPLWKAEKQLLETIEYQEGRLTEDEAKAQEIIDKARGELKQIYEKQEKIIPELREQAEKAAKETKVLFLTATPFNNEKNMQYADGYIFNSQGTAQQVINRADTNDGQFESAENDFDYWLEKTFPAKYYISNGKAKERRGNEEQLDKQQITWNDHAKDLGVLSGQKINIPYDYSRDFPIVSIEHQVDFNTALEDLRKNPQYSVLQPFFPHLIGESGYGDYNWTSYLWEIMKVSGIKERINQHLGLGRKVVIFNRRRYRPGEATSKSVLKRQGYTDADIEDILAQQAANKGLPPMGPPFAAGLERALVTPDAQVMMAANQFAQKYASLLRWEKTIDYRPVEVQLMEAYATEEDKKKYAEAHAKWESDVEAIRKENETLPADKQKNYPPEPHLRASNVGLVRGTGEGVSNASKLKDQETFNNSEKMNIIIVQEASGKEGISLHDTTGKHQRVLICTALPQSPLTFIQIEGRIYRLGNKSDAIYEYPLLGINLELQQFGGRINSSSQTTENLAMGAEARGLRDSIKVAVTKRSGIIPLEGQGHGGKDFDQKNRGDASAKGFDGAIEDYRATQEGLSDAEKNDPEFAVTPHPLGYKMAQWAKINAGENALEPGAGQGILAQYITRSIALTALETNDDLFTKLTLNIGGSNRKLEQKSIREYSVINKHDVILMHPSVGEGGIEAAEQFIEAAKHLEEGGRIVAVIPQSLEMEGQTSKNEENLVRVDGKDYTYAEFVEKNRNVVDELGFYGQTALRKWIEGKAAKSTLIERIDYKIENLDSYLANRDKESDEYKRMAEIRSKIAALREKINAKETELIVPGSDSSMYKLLKTDHDKADFSSVMKGLVRVGEIKLPDFAIGGNVPMKVVVYDQVTRKETRRNVPEAVIEDVSSAKDMDEFFEMIRNISMPERTVDNMVAVEKAAKRFLNTINDNPDLVPKDADSKSHLSDGRLVFNFKTIKNWDGGEIGLTGKYGRSDWLYNIFPYADPKESGSEAKISRGWARRYRHMADRLKLSDADYAMAISKYSEPVEKAGVVRMLEEALLKFLRDGSGLTETQIGRVADGLPAEVSAADIEGDISYDNLKAKFDAANGGDDYRLKMFNKALDKGLQSGLTIAPYQSYGNDAGLYYPSKHSLEVNARMWNRLENEIRARVICHEALHSATTLPLELNERLANYDFANGLQYEEAASIMTPEIRSACDRIENIYKAIMKGPESYKVQGYGLSDSHEMVAELANKDYRAALESRNLWKMPDGSYSGIELPGADKVNAFDELSNAVNALIDAVPADAYKKAQALINGGREPVTEHSVVTEPWIEDKLKKGPTVKVYRAMQMVDGKLYPPMAAIQEGKTVTPSEIGVWEQSDERPDAAIEKNGKWYFKLQKNAKDSGLDARYNPYFHCSRIARNDQFKSAWNRPELVTVECEVPTTELQDSDNYEGYHAEKAYLPTGEYKWNGGAIDRQLPEDKKRKVILSRYCKVTRVVPDAEVAKMMKDELEGTGAYIPENTVTPSVLEELRKIDAPIGPAEPGTKKNNLPPLRYRETPSGVTTVSRADAVIPEDYAENRSIDERLDTANLEATHKVLESMGNALGIRVNRVSREQMPKGHQTAKGYFNPKTGEMAVCLDNVTDMRDAIATVFHEAVGHYGLRQLFGSDFNDMMRNIYAALGSKGRAWVHHYMETHDLQPGDEGIIIGMEEYLSHLAERMNEEPSLWQKIQDIIGRIIDSIFHINGFRFTDNELNYILRASYEHLKDPNWLNTPKGRAFNTLLKRQLGINETDPNKPTDPQGPDAGLRFRDGDETGVANVDYDAQMKKWQTAAVMQNQDKDLPVKIGMEKVMKEVGMKALTDDADYLTRHNQASSRAETEAHDFELFYFKPMLAQVRAIQEKLIGQKATDDQRELAYEKILDYIYAVSGLERNKYKNDEIEAEKQEALNILRANAEAKAEEARQNGESTQEIYDELAKREEAIKKKFEEKKRDWSGLSSLMGMHRSEWREAEVKAQEMVDAFRKEVGDDAELEKLWDSIRACTDFSLDHAYKHGLLTREEYERLHGTASQPRMWEHYVPLRGFNETTAEEEYQYSYNNMANSKVNSVVVKKMNGRWTQADNPLANILNIAETEIVQGNENWAKQALYRFVLQAGENSLLTQRDAWYVKNDDGTWELAIPEENESFEEFEERMQRLHDNIQPDGTQGKPKAKRGRKGLALRNILANKADRNKHLIRLKVGGMDKMIWVNGDPKLAEAVMGSGRENNYKMVRKVSRALSNLFTTYSIDFTARNLIRDTIYSRLALMVKEDNAYRKKYKENWWKNFGVGFAYPMVKLMAEWESGKLQTKGELTDREKMFIDFMHDGGQTGYTIINSISEIKKSLERTMRRAGKEMGAVQIPVLGHIAQAIKTLNEAFELLTRFTAYQTSRQTGRSGQRSASDAKEISVNFNRRGAQTQDGVWGHIAAYLGATQYFYNAGVQGFQNFMHLFKVAPKKMGVATGSLVVLGILTPLINSLIAGLADGIGGGDDNGDDWYWNLPEWVRRNNLVLGVPGFYVAIPLSVELRAFYGLGDVAASLLYGKATARNAWDISLDMMDIAAEILPLNPVEGFTASRNASKNIVQNIGESVGRAIAPDAGMFIVDIMTNRDFTGRPLWKENPFSNTTPRSQSAYASTPKALVEACQGLAKVTNGGIDIPPGAMRDIFRNLGGGLYNLAEDASKLLYADIERPRRWDDIPFFSGFTGHLDKDRMNSFASNALFDYKSNSDDVVRRLNAAAGTDKITKKIAYENPESLPKSARVQMMLEGENYILGKMYYEGMKNEYVMKRRKRTTKYGKEGEWYKSREVKTYGVEALGEQWKALRDEWYAMPEKTKEERDAKKAFSLDVQDAWHRYCNAQNNLVDRLMDEEYYHAETKRKNGIPYEPKRRLNEWGYDKVKDLFE